MSHGGPDWITPVLVNVLVSNVPVAQQPTVQAPAGAAGTYSGTSTSYQTVASWTVTTGKTGQLVEILWVSSNYAKTKIKITIGSVTYCNDFAPQAALPLIFETLQLAAGTVVKVSAESSDGTAIVVDAVITGMEIG